jgi:hypothetical protein
MTAHSQPQTQITRPDFIFVDSSLQKDVSNEAVKVNAHARVASQASTAQAIPRLSDKRGRASTLATGHSIEPYYPSCFAAAFWYQSSDRLQ